MGCINGMIATYTNINSLPVPLVGRRIPKFWPNLDDMRVESCNSRDQANVFKSDASRCAAEGHERMKVSNEENTMI